MEKIAVTPWNTMDTQISSSLEEPSVSLPMASSYVKHHIMTTTGQTLSMSSSSLVGETTKLDSSILTLASAKESIATTRASSIKDETSK